MSDSFPDITKKRLLELVRKYRKEFNLTGYSNKKKTDIIEMLRKLNYKPVYNEKAKRHELRPVKDPSRNKTLK